MFTKRIRILVLSAMIFCMAAETAYAARFVDTNGYWAEKYVNKLSDKGFIPPAADGKFKPNDPITRAQLAVWMVKVLGLDKQPVSSTPSFPDVKPTDSYFKAVEIIRQNNFISGYADGFRPKQFIQRGEMITIISRAMNMAKPDDDAIEQELNRFNDHAKIPQWARQGIAMASKEGVLVTQTPDKVDATAIATRGEAIAMLSALNDYLSEKNVSEKIHKADMGVNDPPAQQPTAAGGPPPQQTQFQGTVQKQDTLPPPTTAYVPPQTGYPQGPPMGYGQPQYGQMQQQPPMQGQVMMQPPMYAPPGGGYPPMYGQGTAQMGYPPPGQMLQGQVSTVAAGTTMNGSLKNSLDSGSTQPGEPVEVTLSQPLFGQNGNQIVPAGSMLIGSVTNVVSAKRFQFGANGKMDIKFTQCVTPDGRRIPLSASVDTTQIRLTGGTTAGRVGKGAVTTAVGAGSGAALGTALGAIVGATSRGGHVGRSTAMGAVFGTALGGGVGLVGAGVRKGSEVKIPAGTAMPIRVDSTFQVTSGGAPQFGGGAPQFGGAPMQMGGPPMGAPAMGGPPVFGQPYPPQQYQQPMQPVGGNAYYQ